MMQAKVPKTILKQSNVGQDCPGEIHTSGESSAGWTSAEKLFRGVNSAHLYPSKGGAMKHIVYPKAYGRNAHVCFNAPLRVNKMFGIKARASAHAKAETCVRLTKKRGA
ncbi:MAG: hypothetical protein EBZ25_04890 [Flavobacteriia bacterium]|nr:hypothetical protein [Flavobacteriia bacterium]